MTNGTRKLARAPIIEAVVDIDCELPPGTRIESLEEGGREQFLAEYPETQVRFLFEQQVEMDFNCGAPSTMSTRKDVSAYLFFQSGRKQLVQIRTQGYSFNRLIPYSSLDDYLPEIERTWKAFARIANPVSVRCVRLRYINRLELQTHEGKVDLDAFFRLGPRLPEEDKLLLVRFLNQYSAHEPETGNFVQTTLTSKKPEGSMVTVILDITAWRDLRIEADDWPQVRLAIDSLRNLKNSVFFNTLTETCLQLYQ